ncbi:hypothetical protein GCM10011609_22780 [Lentzea pudingi]|uniref:Uncharacterized protein n=1 Tax=Lentzea pudingi TaxID=1789439 RepID=A0ABQ2HM43_9PSEU|nr:hypothetical protein GCM10011609_22780 [Lentzea pudingi]
MCGDDPGSGPVTGPAGQEFDLFGRIAPSAFVRAGHVQAHGHSAKVDAPYRFERPPHRPHRF